MSDIRLSVVVPTRNRSESVLRLLKNLREQDFPVSEFEVVVVDDGSEPPLDPATLSAENSFPVQLLRRTSNHGAHESRFAGLRQARGRRVLFMDDDLVAQAGVLRKHAEVEKGFAAGHILYPPESQGTPLRRYQAASYQHFADTMDKQGPLIPPGQFYICNMSGPKDEFEALFEAVGKTYAGFINTPAGLDEQLMAYEFRDNKEPIQLLNNTIVFHDDPKTVAQLRREGQLHGALKGKLLLKYPVLARDFHSADLIGALTWKVKLFWAFPYVFAFVGDVCTWLADHIGWLPAEVSRIPLSISYWEGIRSAIPEFSSLRASIEGSQG